MTDTTQTTMADKITTLRRHLESIVPQVRMISGDGDFEWIDRGITWARATSALRKAQVAPSGEWTIAFGMTGEYGWGWIRADGTIIEHHETNHELYASE